jgi:hypothetical protein
MKSTREKIEKVVSYHKVEDSNLAQLSEEFLDDMLSLIEREKREFKKQLKMEIKYMLNGFRSER